MEILVPDKSISVVMASKFSVINPELSSLGINDCRKSLYMFYDKTTFDNEGYVKCGKAILLNSVVADTEHSFVYSANKNSNSKNVFFNTYVFDVEFSYNSQNIYEAMFVLDSALSSFSNINYDNKGHYVDSFSTYKNTDNSIINETLEDMEVANNIIPQPNFYTIDQQDRINDGFDLLNQCQNLVYYGKDIIDNPNTTIMLFDIQEFYRVLSNVQNDTKDADVRAISPTLLPSVSKLPIEGINYVYDGVNDKSVRIMVDDKRKPNCPFSADYIPNDKILSNISSIKQMLNYSCEALENEYGTIEMFFSPFRFGDKVKINYLDYEKDNQPSNNNISCDKSDSINALIGNMYDDIVDEFDFAMKYN